MQTVGIAGSRNFVQKYRCALIYLLLHRGHMWFQSDQDGRRDEIFFYEGAARIRRDLHIPLVVMNRLLRRFYDQSIMQRSESGLRMIQLGTTIPPKDLKDETVYGYEPALCSAEETAE